MKNYSKYICLFLLLLGTSTHAWGTTVTLNDFGSQTDGSGYHDGGSFTDDGSNTWTANGYKVNSSGLLVIGKGGANFLETPDFGDNVIKSITVTWYENTSYYLTLQTTSGTELDAKLSGSNSSSSPNEETFTVSGSYAQLRLVSRRESGNDNAAATISNIELVYGPPCANNVTINKGTETNCTFNLSVSGSQASCEGVATTVTINPSTGYGTPIVTQSGASAAPTISGSGNTQTVTYGANTTGTSTIAVSCSANNYTVSLDREGATTGAEEITVTYNSSTVTGFTRPEKEGYTFEGYYTGDDGTGTLVLNTSGVLQAGVTGYTGAGGVWTKTTTPTTLYAKWSVHRNKLTLGSPTTVTISSSTPTLAEGEYANVDYGSTVTLAYSSLVDGREWGGWKVTKDADGTNVTASVVSTNTLTMPDYAITVTANTYGSFAFSCADWTLTGPSGDIVFITSAASKTVRSQEAFHVSGSGLPHSTALTFTIFPASSKFLIKKADGTVPSTDTYGKVEADVYVFYTPGEGDTSDGLDEFTSLTVSVTGEPRTATIDTKRVIGRHLPADFVIAAKKDGKWWAMPSDMASTTNPTPVEIAVNDATNPSIAYTVSRTYYGLAGPTAANISSGNGQYIRFAMSIDDGTLDPHAAPLFGTTGTTLGKSGSSQITSDLSEGNWWKLVQTNTSITNPQDAKYTIYCANNAKSLTLEDGGLWGLYATNGTDVDELRLIPASTVVPTEAYFVEWAQHGGVIEVDAGGVGATKVQAVLNGTESAVKTLSQTCTSVKNRASIYNYTLNFNDVGHVIDFAASTSNGAMLTLRWLDGGENLVAVSNITVPKIVATNTSMSSIESGDTPWSKWEVHVLPGVTLTANAGSFSSGDVTIKNLEIYQGATVKVTTGTLDVTNLVLRNGWSRAGSKRYDVARVHIATTANLTHTNAYADWYIDYDQYYPMAVPWDVTVSGISYRYTSLAATVGHDKNIRLRYYDGALRVNGGNGTGTNWRLYGEAGAESVPATLKPSQGYAITAKRAAGKAFAILRMPLTFADTWTTGGEQGRTGGEVKDTVHVIAHGIGANPAKPWYAVGWNFIGNPYMSCFDSNESDFMNKLIAENGGSVKYATIPDTEFEGFDQVNIASVGNKLKPSSGFFVQVGSTGSLWFKQGQIITPSAPARYTNEQEAIPEQEAFILLNGEQGHDQMGLVIGSDYTADYEMNADLSKMLGNANIVKTWMRYTDMDMAYVAINEQLAREWIPVTVHIPAEGEYTYSLMNSSTVDELEGLYLIDYETGAITNLIYDEYIFTAEAGTQSGRFAINAIVGERKVPTGADITGVDKNGNEPVKFIWHDKVFILHNNVIYDSTGKRVNVINK